MEYLPGGLYPGGVSARHPPMNRMTDASENITLPRTVNIVVGSWYALGVRVGRGCYLSGRVVWVVNNDPPGVLGESFLQFCHVQLPVIAL